MTTIAASDELVVLLDSNGRPCGDELKRLVHDDETPLHLAWSCYVVNRSEQVLLTRRSRRKLTWPGVWTNACCGHPAPGESVRQAVERRLGEELGLSPRRLELIFPDFRYRAEMTNGTVENELCPVVVALVDSEPVLNLDEVEAARWCTWAEVLDLVSREAPELSPWSVAQIRRMASVGASPVEWLRGRAPDSSPAARLRWPDLDAPASPQLESENDAIRAVEETLRVFLRTARRDLEVIDRSSTPMADIIERLVMAGGKRLRPRFTYWGSRAAGAGESVEVLTAAAAVELLHTFALIHDDVMDRSTTRRGQPTAHVALGALHRTKRWTGDGEWFGTSAAIVAGDLAFVWAQQLFDAAAPPLDVAAQARSIFRELQIEVMTGQYLDLCLAKPLDGVAATDEGPIEQARRVALLKSGRYTVTRPLQLGATIAGASDELLARLAAYGDAVGSAFQLRDDVLGLMGEESATGKSTSDDVREGKRTVLMLQALSRATPTEQHVLTSALGNRDIDDAAVDRVRQIVVDTGALDAVEREITSLVEVALRAADRLGPPARHALIHLADLATNRRS